MDYRMLGNSNLSLSVAGLGCNNFGLKIGQSETDHVIGKALDLGITFFDTADVYAGEVGNSEELLGKALGTRRKDIVLATKFGGAMNGPALENGGSRTFIFDAVEASLKRLGTDYIDLYQYHQPDGKTPIEETLTALTDLISQGKVRYIGCSKFSASQLADAGQCAVVDNLAGFVSAQNHYSLLTRDIEDDLVLTCRDLGVGLIPFFPLESGLLTGKYRRGEDAPKGSRFDLFGERIASTFLTERNFALTADLQGLADQQGVSLLDLALGWVAHQPAVTSVIAGATTPDQVEQNVKAVAWAPDAATRNAIDHITKTPI